MTLPSWTQQQILNQLDSGSHWSAPAILYRFPTTASGVYAPNGEATTFEPLNTTQKAMMRLAFSTWNDLIAKPISEVVQWSQIDVANTATNSDFAHAYYPTRSSIWFNADESLLQNPIIGGYGFKTFIHESGHAIGLDHMGAYNSAGNWTPSCYQDSSVYSVMSYFGPDHLDGQNQVAWGDWSANGVTYSPQTPMLNDILAIQNIYGTNTTTRSGDTVYGFNSNITGSLSAIYNFTQNPHPILCLYDASGNDTLDLSGWATDSTINLNGGTFSSCNGMTNNISIAYNCLIENTLGGSGADQIIGNLLDNVITGNAGNDVLDGGAGFDTAIFAGQFRDYKIDAGNGHITDTVSNRDGTDSFANIDRLQFADKTAGLDTGVGESTGEVYRLYLTVLDRNPESDPVGCGFWIDKLDLLRAE